MLHNVIVIEKPTHLAVVFDIKSPTFRHALYPKYKAHRRAMPSDIAKAVDIIKNELSRTQIQSLEFEGYEADDIIGTLAKSYHYTKFKIFIVSYDKDFYQLVDEHIFIYKLKRTGKESKTIGLREVCNMYSVADPAQLIDLFTFTGDQSDNIPTVPGFGKRSVKKLLSEFGNIETMYRNINNMNTHVSKLLQTQKDTILLNKELVTINTDVSIDLPPDTIALVILS